MSRLWVVPVGVVGLMVAMSLSSCKQYHPDRFSELGESCRASNDCVEGTSCLGSVCVATEFPVDATSKSCVVVECSTSRDCNPELYSTEYCEEQGGGCELGDTNACAAYQTRCIQTKTCASERCVTLSERACTVYGFYGDGGCDPGYRCNVAEGHRIGQCVVDNIDVIEPDDECDIDLDCPLFHGCQDHSCEYVGCQTDRECVAALNYGLAVCDQESKTCSMPCGNDAECNGADGYNFMGCIDEQCVYLGCETDEECRGQVGYSATAIRIECRETETAK